MKRLTATILILFSMCLICSCKSDIHSRVSDEDWEYIYNLGYEEGERKRCQTRQSKYKKQWRLYGYEDGYDCGHEAGMETAIEEVNKKIDEIDDYILVPFVDEYLNGTRFSYDDMNLSMDEVQAEVRGLTAGIHPY